MYKEVINELSKMASFCDNNGEIKDEICDKIDPSNPDALDNLITLLANVSSSAFDLKYISYYYVGVNIDIIIAYYNKLKRDKKINELLGE